MPTEYESRFPEILAELPMLVDEAVKAGAEAVEQAAKERVPVSTGRLRDAIHTERRGITSYEVVGGDGDAFYGHFVEFGTRNVPPHPFLVPALEGEREVVLAMVSAELRHL